MRMGAATRKLPKRYGCAAAMRRGPKALPRISADELMPKIGIAGKRADAPGP